MEENELWKCSNISLKVIDKKNLYEKTEPKLVFIYKGNVGYLVCT